MRETTPREDLLRGIWKENPVLVQLLGLCPALAVTNTVPNSIAMGSRPSSCSWDRASSWR